MSTIYARLTLPFRSPSGRDLGSKHVEITLVDPPAPHASVTVEVPAYGRRYRVPLRVPTVVNGKRLAAGTTVEVQWPTLEAPPDAIEVATVEREGGAPMHTVKEVYRFN